MPDLPVRLNRYGFKDYIEDAYAELELTDAEARALNGTPQTIVAAPGAGKIILPYMVIIDWDTTAGAWTSDVILTLLSAGASAPFISSTDVALALNSTAARSFAAGMHWSPFVGPTSEIVNKALQIASSADSTGGNAANTFTVRVWYWIVDTN